MLKINDDSVELPKRHSTAKKEKEYQEIVDTFKTLKHGQSFDVPITMVGVVALRAKKKKIFESALGVNEEAILRPINPDADGKPTATRIFKAITEPKIAPSSTITDIKESVSN